MSTRSTRLFRLETGVLLGKDDPEYEAYSQVYTKNFGFYDEDVAILFDYEDAKDHAKSYINDGVNRTYAVITSDIADLADEVIQAIKDGEFTDINDFSFDEKDILYFAYKDNMEIKTEIDRKE